MPDRLRGLVLRTGIPQRAWNGAWSPGSLLGIKPYEWLRYNYFVGNTLVTCGRLRGSRSAVPGPVTPDNRPV